MKNPTKQDAYEGDWSVEQRHAEEAKQFIRRSKEIGPDAAQKEFEETAKAQCVGVRLAAAEIRIKKVLSECGGDKDKAIQVLAINVETLLSQISEQRQADAEQVGRPNTVWGPDSCGKHIVKVMVDEQIERMRTQKVKKPKIRAAIAQAFGLNPEKTKDRLRIADLASRYSEATEALRTSQKSSEN